MKLSLQIFQSGRDGATTAYQVDGLPPGHMAWIANFGTPNLDRWRILQAKDGIQGKWTGDYGTANEALAVLQKEHYGITVRSTRINAVEIHGMLLKSNSTDCEECDKLWRIYSYAARQHMDYIRLRETAARGADIEKMKELETVVSAAAEWRDLARAQVKMHEMTHQMQNIR